MTEHNIIATRHTTVSERDSRHEQLRAERVRIVSITVETVDGERREFVDTEWDIEVLAR